MKRHLKIALDGAAKGVAVQYLATLAASICLHLGYFMPYPAFLPRRWTANCRRLSGWRR